MKIKHIYEPTDLQCGQAVIAMVAGKTVDEVVELLCNDRETNLKEMSCGLLNYGYKLDEKRVPVTVADELPDLCLLSLETPRCWHWSLYFHGKFYDPEHGVLEDFPESNRRYYWKITPLTEEKIPMDKMTYESHIKEILISEEEIKREIIKAGKDIDQLYDGSPILLVSILKGSFVFLADLARAVSVPCEIGFMAAKSYYASTESSGIVKITMDLDQDIRKYHVIIVEDIIDTGRTLKDVVRLLSSRDPLSLRVITLLDKPSRRAVDFQPDTALFTIEDRFVIGYGLDFGEKYRNLPYIAEYKE